MAGGIRQQQLGGEAELKEEWQKADGSAQGERAGGRRLRCNDDLHSGIFFFLHYLDASEISSGGEPLTD